MTFSVYYNGDNVGRSLGILLLWLNCASGRRTARFLYDLISVTCFRSWFRPSQGARLVLQRGKFLWTMCLAMGRRNESRRERCLDCQWNQLCCESFHSSTCSAETQPNHSGHDTDIYDYRFSSGLRNIWTLVVVCGHPRLLGIAVR